MGYLLRALAQNVTPRVNEKCGREDESLLLTKERSNLDIEADGLLT
jgi:hypothetical protein